MGRIGGSIRELKAAFADMYRAVLQACKGIRAVECVRRECLLPEVDECTVELAACKPRMYKKREVNTSHNQCRSIMIMIKADAIDTKDEQ